MPAIAIAVAGAAASYAASAGAVALGIAAAGSFAATLIGGIVGLVVTMGLSLLFGGAQRKGTAATAADRQQAVRSAIAPRNFVYGRALVSGPVVYIGSSGTDNEYFHVVVPVAGHVIDGFDMIRVNGFDIPVTGLSGTIYVRIPQGTTQGAISSSYVSTAGFPSGGSHDGYIRLKLYDGTQTLADSDLVAECGADIDANFKLLGVAYVYARITFSQDVFPSGFSNLAAQVRGKHVFDPRTSSTAYSDNAALAIRDYLTDPLGLAAASAELDDTFWIAAANICDEAVAIDVAGTTFLPRYTIDGSFTLDQKPADIMDGLLAACAGTITYVQGVYRLYVGAYDAPTVSIGEGDFAGGLTVQTVWARADQFNTVDCTYIEPSQSWAAVAAPQVQDAAYVTADGAPVGVSVQLLYTLSAYVAQRLMQLYLLRHRTAGLQLQGRLKYSALRMAVWDTASVTLPDFGLSAAPFRLTSWSFDPVSGLVDVKMQAEASAAYSWTASDAQPPIIAPSTTLSDPLALPAPGTPTLTASTDTLADGTVTPAILVALPTPASPYVTQTEVQWQAAGDATWSSVLVAVPATQFEIAPVRTGVTYSVRIRFIAALIRSAWSATATLGGPVKATAPAVPTGLAATAVQGGYSVSFTRPADTDLAAVEIWEQPSGAGSYSYVAETSGAGLVIHTGAADYRSRSVEVRARNTTGLTSAFSGAVSVTPQQVLTADIATGNVVTGSLGANAATAVYVGTSTSSFGGGGAWNTAVTLSVSAPINGPVQVSADYDYTTGSPGTGFTSARIKVDGSVVITKTISGDSQDNPHLLWAGTLTSGSHTIVLEWSGGTADAAATNFQMAAILAYR